MKIFTLIFTLIPCLVSAEETIPLPPISPKQQASIQKEKAKDLGIAKTNPIKETLPQIKNENFTLKRIELGVVKDSGELYLPLTSSLCLIMNEKDSQVCRIKEYANDKEAFLGLINGEIDLLVTNSLAVNNLQLLSDKIDKNRIRFMNYFFTESFLALVKKETMIENFTDLQDISFSISSQATGELLNIIRKDKGWNQVKDTFIKPQEGSKALCNNSVKLISFLTEILNQEVKDVTRACEVKVVKFSKEEIAKITKNLGLFHYTLPGGTYLGIPEPVETVAIKSIVVTTSDLRDEEARFFLKSLTDNLTDIKSLHLAFKDLTHENLFAEPLLQEHQILEEFKIKK
jgi:TRAP transporter TAXI family solute receptor